MARIAKNELVAGKAQMDVIVYKDGGLTPADAGTDFIALGLVFVPDASNLPHYKVATGTFKQKRRALVVADDVVESVDTGTDTLTLTAHLYKTGDGPLFGDEAIGGITAPPDPGFYIIKVDDNTIAIATTIADAFNDVRLALTGTEAGATISDSAATQRAIPGFFTYTAPAGETNVSLNEFTVMVDGPGFSRLENGGGYATAELDTGVDDTWSVMSSEGLTNQQKLNLAVRTLVALFTKTTVGATESYVVRKLDDSGDSHSADVTPDGKVAINIIDPS